MYSQEEKPKENKNRAVADSITQKKSNVKQGVGVVDNRPEAIAQKKLQELMNDSPQRKHITQLQSMTNVNGKSASQNTGVIQRVQTMTITNTVDNYDSGWLQAETQSTGVGPGPRLEAQTVAQIAGGYWIGGHMVNDRLGGGGGFGNIVPITSSMNNQHHTMENAAQNIVGNQGTDYEVRYYMSILNRSNYIFTPNNDVVNNLPDQFQQHYSYRTKEVQAGGTISRPRAYQPPGPETTIAGKVLNMNL
ncbi:hypothetical protein [Pectobacterium polaris]|uniref:hypothetical protein n=1 Tax=Pectobacterium polaris TaxID=2042057 RepID=UPI0024067708|nr:hypothetical protein [Pectobacterium polaris]MDG0803407.1 hypothetical protein [Pectobacterium polaris]